ncbi:MAG TPA: YicC/YloC family endoribonuclease [Longimicrobiales bacterium]
MIRSMTGFGQAEVDSPAGRLRAEVKTVNHRYFVASIRLPPTLERYEPQVRERLRAILPRGHVTFSLRLERPDAEGDAPVFELDEARARQYLRALQTLKERLQVPGEVDLALLSRFGDLIVAKDSHDAEIPVEALEEVTDAAARACLAMRSEEGRRLRADLEERLEAIAASLARIVERAPARLIAERDRLRRVIAELAQDVSVDEERLAREIAYLAERWDVSEETVRLRSHMELFRHLLADTGEEPVGKRLGFLVQEMHREANTIGAKANDAAIEHEVVAIKNEIERLREQIENVE